LLNIHKETELGDNDDLKKKKSTLSAGNTTGGGCCGNGQIELEQR
jgi:complex III assembly factor LYRM7